MVDVSSEAIVSCLTSAKFRDKNDLNFQIRESIENFQFISQQIQAGGSKRAIKDEIVVVEENLRQALRITKDVEEFALIEDALKGAQSTVFKIEDAIKDVGVRKSLIDKIDEAKRDLVRVGRNVGNDTINELVSCLIPGRPITLEQVERVRAALPPPALPEPPEPALPQPKHEITPEFLETALKRDLQEALRERGLDTKGLKRDLIERLRKFG